MFHRFPLIVPLAVILPLLAMLATLAACKEHEVRYQPASECPEDADPALVLRSYDVPEGYGQQLRGILLNTFAAAQEKIGARADLSPDGQLVVVAPAGIHEGVADLIEKMKGREPPPAPPTVQLDYWLVIGRPASGEGTVHGAMPAEIEPVLDTLRGAHGAMDFKLVDRVRIASLADTRGTSAGRLSHVSQVATLADDQVVADLEITIEGLGRPSRLETRVALAPGKLLVLGESGTDAPAEAWPLGGERTAPTTLFYIVRSTVDNPS